MIIDNPMRIKTLRIYVDKPLMSTCFFCSAVMLLYPEIKLGKDLTKNPTPIRNNPIIKGINLFINVKSRVLKYGQILSDIFLTYYALSTPKFL